MVVRNLALICALCIFISACSTPSAPPSSEGQTSSPTQNPTPLPTAALLPIPTPADPYWAKNRLDGMSLQEKIGQIFLMGIAGRELSESSCEMLQHLRPGGIFFRLENAANPEQLRQFTREIQDCAQAAAVDQSAQAIPLITALDHEGESVYRFAGGATIFPDALAQAATGNPAYAYQVARSSGQELAFSGINMVLGPDADVLRNYDNRVVALRTFGDTPQEVSEFVAQAVKGYQEAGLIPVLKHFPGHGGVASDSHQFLPSDQAEGQLLETVYLPPFRSGLAAGAPVVMVSHIAFPNVSGNDLPASMSAEIIRLLRDKLKFEGIVLSDAMDMLGVTDSGINISEASLKAVNAGVDMLLIPSPEDAQASFEHLLSAVETGELAVQRIDEAVLSILKLKALQGLNAYPVVESGEPAWQENAKLAFEVGERSVAVLKDAGNLIPLPADIRRVLIIGPDASWDFYPKLEAAIKQRGIQSDRVNFSPPWEDVVKERELLQTLPVTARSYDLVILFTWQSHIQSLAKDQWQMKLARGLAKNEQPIIVVALKSPTDWLDFPRVDGFISTFGQTPGALEGVIRILTGEASASGKSPLPGMLQVMTTGDE
jgi:beta-N-acetylhexosaminidase